MRQLLLKRRIRFRQNLKRSRREKSSTTPYKEMNGLVTIDEAELRQGEYPIAIERKLEGEVEAGERLDRRKPAHSQCGLDPAVRVR